MSSFPLNPCERRDRSILSEPPEKPAANAANLPLASSSEVSKRFGCYYDDAMIHPVGIELNGVARVVMLSLPEHRRLALLDQVATASSEMPDEDYKALRSRQGLGESARIAS
jgi:hypothetical protein